MSERYPVQIEGEDGWSEWQQPKMAAYKMACCDCGLVHDMEFEVARVVGEDGPKISVVKIEKAYGKELVVLFRARRNNRSTAAMRRKKGELWNTQTT